MSGINSHSRVLAVALDAAEPRLIEQWMNEGVLPNLKQLYDRGSYGRLASTADWLAGSPWPTFYTGTLPSNHGLYHYLQWNASEMAFTRPDPDWLPIRPFWRDLSDQNRRVITVDIPMTFAPEPINGVEIAGWATQDRLVDSASYPPSVLAWINREFGPPPLVQEAYGPQRIRSLLRLRDELIRSTMRVAEVAKALMSREKWDLFMVNFGATHLGGHKLWDLSGAIGDAKRNERAEFSNALKDIYTACDSAVGRLIDKVGKNVTVLIFSLHGMGANTSRAIVLPSMLDHVLANIEDGSRPYKKKSFLQFSRELIPIDLRQGIKSRLPLKMQDKLTSFWRMGKVDWAKTSAFNLIADLQGYIRINLCGREAIGVVNAGEDYDTFCTKIREGLRTYVDSDTGKPVVDDIARSDQLFTEGPRRDRLPDIIVRWSSSPASNCRAIESSIYGSIQWPTPGRNPDGRSGNHLPEGFIIASGDYIRASSRIEDVNIMDLAPTLFGILDVPKPVNLNGKMIPCAMMYE